MISEAHYDTIPRVFWKKVRGIDLTVAGVAAVPTQIIFRPFYGMKYIVRSAYTYNAQLAGTITDAPAIILDNGTDSQNIVASVDLVNTQDVLKVLTVIAPPLFITHDTPLRLKSADGADGSTIFSVNLTVELFQING